MTSDQCRMCVHYWGAGACEAFQENIPEEIIVGEFDHTNPYPGDNGIRFELDPNLKELESENVGIS